MVKLAVTVRYLEGMCNTFVVVIAAACLAVEEQLASLVNIPPQKYNLEN